MALITARVGIQPQRWFVIDSTGATPFMLPVTPGDELAQQVVKVRTDGPRSIQVQPSDVHFLPARSRPAPLDSVARDSNPPALYVSPEVSKLEEGQTATARGRPARIQKFGSSR